MKPTLSGRIIMSLISNLNGFIKRSKKESSVEKMSLTYIQRFIIRFDKLFIRSCLLLNLKKYVNSRSLTYFKATLNIILNISYKDYRLNLK